MNKINFKLFEINNKIEFLCKSNSYENLDNLLKNLKYIDKNILEIIYNLLLQKLKIQKSLFKMQGNDNIIFMGDYKCR